MPINNLHVGLSILFPAFSVLDTDSIKYLGGQQRRMWAFVLPLCAVFSDKDCTAADADNSHMPSTSVSRSIMNELQNDEGAM